jgi:hypothetical protein
MFRVLIFGFVLFYPTSVSSERKPIVPPSPLGVVGVPKLVFKFIVSIVL